MAAKTVTVLRVAVVFIALLENVSVVGISKAPRKSYHSEGVAGGSTHYTAYSICEAQNTDFILHIAYIVHHKAPCCQVKLLRAENEAIQQVSHHFNATRSRADAFGLCLHPLCLLLLSMLSAILDALSFLSSSAKPLTVSLPFCCLRLFSFVAAFLPFCYLLVLPGIFPSCSNGVSSCPCA
jgi:hypothetical protein